MAPRGEVSDPVASQAGASLPSGDKEAEKEQGAHARGYSISTNGIVEPT